MMTPFETGSPAFPGPCQHETKLDIHEGMTLRDYFAGQAMIAIIIRREMTPTETYSRSESAAEAYHYADAMLQASRL